jgi:hypothetical protein
MVQRLPDWWQYAARCAVRVLLPVPPFRDAMVMTFMRESPKAKRRDAAANMVNEWLRPEPLDVSSIFVIRASKLER